jgi:hypothetical protein
MYDSVRRLLYLLTQPRILPPPVGRGHLLPAHVAPDERVELLVMVSTTVLWVGGCSARVVVQYVLPVLAH